MIDVGDNRPPEGILLHQGDDTLNANVTAVRLKGGGVKNGHVGPGQQVTMEVAQLRAGVAEVKNPRPCLLESETITGNVVDDLEGHYLQIAEM